MKRLNIYLYDDEYNFIKAKSEAERISMNKVFQFLIRDISKDRDNTKMTPKEVKIKDNDTKVTPKKEKKEMKFSPTLGRYI